MRKIKKSPRSIIFAISILFGSILLSSCNTSINTEPKRTNISSKKSEVNLIPATKEEMNFYRQIGISYFCLARQSQVDFPKSISIASNNFSLLVSRKHGGLIEEIGDIKLSNDKIYQGSYLQIIEGAIQICPDQVPEDDKKKFLEAVEKLNQNK